MCLPLVLLHETRSLRSAIYDYADSLVHRRNVRLDATRSQRPTSASGQERSLCGRPTQPYLVRRKYSRKCKSGTRALFVPMYAHISSWPTKKYVVTPFSAVTGSGDSITTERASQ